MCSRARGPASEPSLVTWPTSTVATWRALARPDQLVGALAHLADRAGDPGGPPLAGGGRPDGHGLDGVDDHQVGLGLDHGVDHLAHVGGRQDQQPGRDGAQPLGPQAHLVGRLLGRHQQDPVAGRGPGRQHLEQQGRLADARLAAEQGDRARAPGRPRAPGRTPPPRSGTAAASDTSTEDRGTGMARQVEVVHRPDQRTRAAASSTRVFHSPQVGHRPAHRAVVEPQSMQRWRLAVFAMPRW